MTEVIIAIKALKKSYLKTSLSNKQNILIKGNLQGWLNMFNDGIASKKIPKAWLKVEIIVLL